MNKLLSIWFICTLFFSLMSTFVPCTFNFIFLSLFSLIGLVLWCVKVFYPVWKETKTEVLIAEVIPESEYEEYFKFNYYPIEKERCPHDVLAELKSRYNK